MFWAEQRDRADVDPPRRPRLPDWVLRHFRAETGSREDRDTLCNRWQRWIEEDRFWERFE